MTGHNGYLYHAGSFMMTLPKEEIHENLVFMYLE